LQENIDTFKAENDVDAVSEEDSTRFRSDELFTPSAEPEVSCSFRIFFVVLVRVQNMLTVV
jgi:hypothetical protein